jgi:N-acyl-D-aspartate/D-glutamate deacylase
VGATAKRTIDAEGRVVAPGFIDHHTHFDPQAVWDPYCGSSVQNGHTTIVVGQCGQVIAPVRPGDGEWYLQFFSDAEQIPLPVLKAGVEVTWESVGDYLDALGRKRGCNVGALYRTFWHPPLCDGRGRLGAGQGDFRRARRDAAAGA